MFKESEAIGDSPRRRLALDCLAAGINAAHPDHIIPERIARDDGQISIDGSRYDLSPFERIEVIGAGKAAGVMARALEEHLAGWIDGGVVVTSDPQETRYIRQVEGAHPIPDASGRSGGEAVQEVAESADRDTLLIVVLTGGGSALLPVPVKGVSLDEVQEVTSALLEAGASIKELNTVRKHLSEVKGGQLARSAAPATVLGLLVSDVVGNDPSTIASGPVTPDPTTSTDALAVLSKYEVRVPAPVRSHLIDCQDDPDATTPGPGEQVFNSVSTHILADNHTALTGAAREAAQQGFRTEIISIGIEGEAQAVGTSHADMAIRVQSQSEPVSPPAVLLSGGETTVTVRGNGRGGPNQEVAVGAALRLATQDAANVVIGSVDTDGIDGNSGAAGGLIDSETVTDPARAAAALEANNTTEYLETRQGLLVTGFTGTNVNDLRIIVVGLDSPE